MNYKCKVFMIHQNLLALTCLIQFKVYFYFYGKDAHNFIEICFVEGKIQIITRLVVSKFIDLKIIDIICIASF